LPNIAEPAPAADFSGERDLTEFQSRIVIANLQRERLGLLSGVAGERFTSGINTQLLGAAGAELVLGQHSENRFAHNLFGAALQHRPDGNFLQPARVTAVMTINLLVDLISRKSNGFRVNYNDVIAAVEVRGVARLIFADRICPVTPFRQRQTPTISYGSISVNENGSVCGALIGP
jgi:hypothetical protein